MGKSLEIETVVCDTAVAATTSQTFLPIDCGVVCDNLMEDVVLSALPISVTFSQSLNDGVLKFFEIDDEVFVRNLELDNFDFVEFFCCDSDSEEERKGEVADKLTEGVKDCFSLQFISKAFFEELKGIKVD